MADATSPPGQTSAREQDESQVREKAQEVAGQAQEKAQEAAGQAQSAVRDQVDRRSTQAGERIGGTAEDLRSVGEELRKQGKDTPARYADQGADRVERLGSYLRDADAETILADVEDFGRRQPLAVLAGGLVVGVAAARFLKASSRGRYQSRLGSREGQTREIGARSTAAPIPDTAGQSPPMGTPVAAPTEAPVPTGPAPGR